MKNYVRVRASGHELIIEDWTTITVYDSQEVEHDLEHDKDRPNHLAIRLVACVSDDKKLDGCAIIRLRSELTPDVSSDLPENWIVLDRG